MDTREELKSITNRTITELLKATRSTEHPPLMSVWAALSCCAAAANRHVWFDFKIKHIYPNMFVILSGIPATKKSQAMKPFVNMLKRATDQVKYAPDDTAGMKQGLMESMKDPLVLEGTEEQLDAILTGTGSIESNFQPKIAADRYTMFIAAGELGSILGASTLDLLRFLIKGWEGDDYKYRLKKSQDMLPNTLLNMLGATTPEDLAKFLPTEAVGQGLPSRIIFVNDAKQAKIAWPEDVESALTGLLEPVYSWASKKTYGEMAVTPQARAKIEAIYMEFEVDITDTRFNYYSDRRQEHTIKLAMNMSLMDKRMEITAQDVEDAHRLLCITEIRMPDALGVYGLSPVSQARQALLDFLGKSETPVPENVLWHLMSKDMRHSDFMETLGGYVQEGKIERQTLTGLGVCYVKAVAKSMKALGKALEGIADLL